MNLRLLLLLSYFSLVSTQLFAQNFEWVTTGGDFGLDIGFSVETDGDGNVHTFGVFNGTVDFNEGGEPWIETSEGSRDAFILKQNSSGELIWLKTFSSFMGVQSGEIVIDPAGNVFATGDFGGTADFDPGAGVEERTATGGSDCYIVKLNSSGDLQWVKTFAAGSYASIWGTTLDTDGNLISVGNFGGTVDFDPGAGEALRTAGEYQEMFVQKLNPDGEFLWVNHYESSAIDTDISTDVTTTSDGNILFTGKFYGTIDFDLSAGVEELTAQSSGASVTVKLNSLGELIWARQITADGNQSLKRSLTTSPSGAVYILGQYAGTMDLDPGPGEELRTSNGGSDIFVQKLDVNGDLIWIKTYGSLASDYCGSIRYDESGNICVYATYAGTMDIDPSEDADFEITAAGGYDLVCSILDYNGKFIWGITFGGEMNDHALGMTADDDHNIYMTGYYNGTADFDFGPSTELRTSNGGDDFFILKLSETLSLKEDVNKLNVLIYPNPANDQVIIQTEKGNQIELIDFTGRVVINKKAVNDQEKIDLTAFSAGLYFVRIYNDKEAITKKLIVK